MELEKVVTACPVVSLEVVQWSCRRGEIASLEEGEDREVTVAFIVAAAGPNLLVFPMDDKSPLRSSTAPAVLPVLNSHSITAIKHVRNGQLLILGNRSLTLLQLHCTDPLSSFTIEQIHSLPDLVLDAQLITYDNSLFLLIGYAQNFVDFYSLNEHEVKLRVKCPVVCVLFSLAFAAIPLACDSKMITIASGTAMGQIVVWTASINVFQPPSHDLSTPSELAATTCSLLVTLQGHNGIIWKVRWSESKDRLVSVSDDRTVRVWDISKGVEIFCGYGHICRVWDAIFVGRSEDAVATCGEDSTIKVWDLQNQKCIMTMHGHAHKHIWCLSQLLVTTSADVERESFDTVLLSGGNDNCINLWSLSMHALLNREHITSPQECESSSFSLLLQDVVVENSFNPLSQLSSTTDLSTSLPEQVSNEISVTPRKRQQSIIAHRVSGCGTIAVVITQCGVWMVNLDIAGKQNGENRLESDSCKFPGWSNVFVSEKGGINASDAIVFEIEKKYLRVECVCVHSQGYITYMRWEYNPSCYVNASEMSSDNNFTNNVVHNFFCEEWKGHHRNSMNVVFAPSSHIIDTYSEGIPLETCTFFITMSVQGECKLWKAFYEAVDVAKKQLYECIQVFTPKGNIATSGTLLHELNCLVVGDCRGNISLYNIDLSDSNSSIPIGGECSVFETTPCCQYFPKIHGLEIVSCVRDFEGGFCSLGYDGYIAVFALQNNFDDRRNPQFNLMSRLSCSPITSPDQIFYKPLSLPGREHIYSLYVAGYQASDYIIYDVRKKIQILKLGAGGWKRPHRSSIKFHPSGDNLLGITFVYSLLADTGSIYKCVRYKALCDNPHLITTASSRNISSQFSIYSSNLPLQLGIPSLGKVAYCGIFFGVADPQRVLLAIGSEDGTIKVFSIYKSMYISRNRGASEKYHRYRFVQEVQMPSNVAARTICHCKSSSGSFEIIVAGGGRLLYSIWTYGETKSHLSAAPMDFVLREIYASSNDRDVFRRGNKKGKSRKTDPTTPSVSQEEVGGVAKQDHRILASAAMAVPTPFKESEEQFIIALSDSRGVTKVVCFKYIENVTDSSSEEQANASQKLHVGDSSRFEVINEEEFTASDYPLLSCEVLSMSAQINSIASSTGDYAEEVHCHLSVMGDTHGGIHIWLLGTSHINGRALFHTSRPLLSYQGHTMGSNTISSSQEKPITHHDIHGNFVTSIIVTVCSGADDQSITIARFNLKVSRKDNDSTMISLEVNSIRCVEGASGSAIKGVRLFQPAQDTDNLQMTSVGYDQRVSLWNVEDVTSKSISSTQPYSYHIVFFDELVDWSSKRKFEGEVCNDQLSSPGSHLEHPVINNNKNPVHISRDQVQLFSLASGGGMEEFLPLKWIGGAVVNVGDVNGVALLPDENSILIGVVGEGFQVLERQNEAVSK